jgi:hypothetical protein
MLESAIKPMWDEIVSRVDVESGPHQDRPPVQVH